ncbi:MAG: hypothetical protein ABW158_20600 [Candidatus Thiodiazotropha sp. 6PDIVS]
MPDGGPKSNFNSNLFTQWEANSKGFPEELDSVITLEACEGVFDTLAEWNSYLEQHVPYFSGQEEPETIQPD